LRTHRSLTRFLERDRQPESQGIEQRFEAAELGISILGQHSVQVLPIQLRDLRKLRHAAPGSGDVKQAIYIVEFDGVFGI